MLLFDAGLATTFAVCASELEEHFIRGFDRKYGVKTAGSITLPATSLAQGELTYTSGYRPVNAGAFRRLLKALSLSRTLHFADLGSGLGRACILASEYGFTKVTGVDISSQFCETARRNILAFRARMPDAPFVEILHADLLDYCEDCDADVFFMYRAFSGEFLHRVLRQLTKLTADRNKKSVIIYCENVCLSDSHASVFAQYRVIRKLHEHSFRGFLFLTYECGA